MKRLIFTLLVLLSVTGAFAIAPIIGTDNPFCRGGTAYYTDSTPGGFWLSNNPAAITIDSLTGFARCYHIDGTPLIYYIVGSDTAFHWVEMDTLDYITMNGPSTVCAGSSINLYLSSIFTSYTYKGFIRTWSSSSPGVAVTGAEGYETTVTGVSAGTAVITYNVNATCPFTTTITVTAGSCTGTPTSGTASFVSAGLGAGSIDTLTLTGYTSCGTALQWQTSPDGSSWTDLPGLICTKVHCSPLDSAYYRCKVTCVASGLSSYSNTVFIPHHNLIASHSIISSDTSCSFTNFCLTAAGISNTLNATTYYGDGASDNMALTAGDCSANFIHTYLLPGVYTIKQVLYQGTAPQDSVSFSYNYEPCVFFYINFYQDLNSNCLFDTTDIVNIYPITTEIDSNGIPVDTISATSGFFYKGYEPAGTIYTFRVISTPPALAVTCPSAGVIADTVLAGVSHYPAKYFGLHCSGTSMDLHINSSSVENYRYIASGLITAGNNYCVPHDATVTLYFSPKYIFDVSIPYPSSLTGNKAIWDIHNLSYDSLPVNIFYILVTPNILDSTTWLTAHDTVHSDITITPFAGDTDTTNNHIFRVDTVRSSWDPNAMLVSPAGNILPCTPLQYTIEFENTGNDTAHNIHIMDTLSDYVNINSLKIVTTSAEVMNTVFFKTADGHNVVKFDFPGINLLDSSHHNQCTGLIVFTINAKNGLADGIDINNRAGIYFDDNAVVMTNGVTNTTGMPPIAGPDGLCGGQQAVYTCNMAGGAWRSSNAAATVNGGLVTAVSLGVDTISYMVSNACTSRTSAKAISISSTAPSVSITAQHGLIAGSSETLTAHVTNGGPSPAYQWLVDGVAIPGATSATYVSGKLAVNDSVSCHVSGAGGCGTLYLSATVFVGTIPMLTPNPNKGAFNLSGAIGTASGSESVALDVKNTIGQQVYKTTITINNSMLNNTIQLPPAIARGLYLLTLYTPNGRQVLHFVVE